MERSALSRPRDRKSADGLLPRMEARPWKDGKTVSYRYHPLGASGEREKPINLGTDKHAALQKVLDLTGRSERFGTLEWVWEKFTDEQRPAARWKRLSDGTKTDYRTAWKQLKKRFGRMQIGKITAPIIARYVHVERADSPRRATIEKALLSNLFKHAILLGVCDNNPCGNVEPHQSEASTVLPQTLVLAKFLEWLERQSPQRRIIGMAAEYASLAGNRQVEFRPLCWPQVDRETKQIRVKRAKQRKGKRIEVIEVIAITPRMDALLDRLAALNRGCLYVFPTRHDTMYSARGFATLWQRCVKAAIDEGVIKPSERFNFHALRAYYATMHKQQTGALPDMHRDPGTTARVYDRSTEVKRSAL